MDARPSNLSCVAPAKTAATGTAIQLQRVFPNLTFNQPLAMLQAPGDDTRWFVLEKGSGTTGTTRVRVFPNQPSTTTTSDFLSLTVNANSEGGLLGMAFHPQWTTNRQAFVSYTVGTPMVSVVARFTSSNNGATLDAMTRQEIIRVNQPADNHNGGEIAFGPNDGFLYFGLGDGGNGGDSPQMTGQDTTDLLGSFLRLDVDTSGAPYEIPPDNPFAGASMCTADHTVSANNCPEIYAWGFRNPWRWSFDSATGDLWAGDVGQNAFEEIDRVQRGGNYGWNCREGLSAYNNCPTPASNFINPVHDYGRALGFSVTGGYVYRGSAIPG
ncbi:MAG TPA: PQQ-dependent sugar dehydrogenase, partial [Gammaproteobacteria bacterium]